MLLKTREREREVTQFQFKGPTNLSYPIELFHFFDLFPLLLSSFAFFTQKNDREEKGKRLYENERLPKLLIIHPISSLPQ